MMWAPLPPPEATVILGLEALSAFKLTSVLGFKVMEDFSKGGTDKLALTL